MHLLLSVVGTLAMIVKIPASEETRCDCSTINHDINYILEKIDALATESTEHGEKVSLENKERLASETKISQVLAEIMKENKHFGAQMAELKKENKIFGKQMAELKKENKLFGKQMAELKKENKLFGKQMAELKKRKQTIWKTNGRTNQISQ